MRKYKATTNDKLNQPMDSHHSIPLNLEILPDILGDNVYSWRRYMCVFVWVNVCVCTRFVH